MSRCGCAEGSCACNFAAGPGILLTGNGRRGNPLTIGLNNDVMNPPGGGFEGELHLGNPVWGAAGDGVTDDSQAVAEWLTAMIAGEAHPWAPQGNYLLNDPFVAASLNAARVAIWGAGEGLTNFIVPASNTQGAFLFDAGGTPRSCRFHFCNFSIITRGDHQGSGIKLIMQAGGAEHHRNLTIENVGVTGENGSTNSFNIGIWLKDVWRPYLRNVTVNGPFGLGVDGDQTDGSPLYQAHACLRLNNSYAPHIESCNLWSADLGIEDIGTNAEGMLLTHTRLVGVNTGLLRYRTLAEPGMKIIDCHVNARKTGLDLDGSKVVQITNCHIYNQDDTNEYTADGDEDGIARDIWLKNTELVQIIGNEFQFPGPTDRINVHVEGSASGEDSIIALNIFNALADTAILLGVQTHDITVALNRYSGNITNNIIDNSGVNNILEPEGDGWVIENQGAGAVSGPLLELFRNSSSPANADILGKLGFPGKTDTGVKVDYAALRGKILDVTNASPDGELQLLALINGVLTVVARAGAPTTDATGTWLLTNQGGTVALQQVVLAPAVSGLRYLAVAD